MNTDPYADMPEAQPDPGVAMLRLPPHSVEAEQSVLGAILINPKALADVGDVLGAEDFFKPAHRKIYQAVIALDAVDVITVADKLAAAGDLDDVGGLPYLMDMTQGVPSVANVRAYAELVRDKSLERSLIQVSNQIADDAYTGDRSTTEKLASAQSQILALGESEPEQQLYGNDALKEFVDTLEQRTQGSSFGLSTGFKDLDKRTHGLQGSDLIILAARPSMGKTTLAIQLAVDAAVKSKVPVLFFSMEMSRRQIYDKIMACHCKVPLSHIRNGEMLEQDWTKIQAGMSTIKDAPLFVDDRAALHISQIQATARRFHGKRELGLIVVDYLQLARGEGENKNLEIGAISAGLKAIAKELDVPVIALSQLNRALEQRNDKRPRNSDLRESGNLEQDADLIAFLYRDEVYNEDTNDKGIAEVIWSKFRNGEIGTDRVASQLQLSRLDDLSMPYVAVDNAPIKRKSGGFEY